MRTHPTTIQLFQRKLKSLKTVLVGLLTRSINGLKISWQIVRKTGSFGSLIFRLQPHNHKSWLQAFTLKVLNLTFCVQYFLLFLNQLDQKLRIIFSIMCCLFFSKNLIFIVIIKFCLGVNLSYSFCTVTYVGS